MYVVGTDLPNGMINKGKQLQHFLFINKTRRKVQFITIPIVAREFPFSVHAKFEFLNQIARF